MSEWIELLCVTVESFGVDRPSIEAGRARFPLRGCTASVYRAGCAEDGFEVELVDMSASGAGFTSLIELESGEPFRMRFDSEELGGRDWEMAVAWSSRRADGMYMIGAKRLERAQSPSSTDPVPL